MAGRDYRWYVSLDQVKDALGLTTTDEDGRLKRLIQQGSRWAEEVARTTFYPVTETRYFDAPEDEPGRVWFRDWLVALTGLSDDAGTFASDDYILYPLDGPPYRYLELNPAEAYFTYSDSTQKAIAVAGRWGYSTEATESLDTVQNASGMSTSDTTLTVSNGAQFEVGWTLLVEDEQMFVLEVAGNNLLVVRGQNGTTAAEHANGTEVERLLVPYEVEAVVEEWVKYHYNRRDLPGVTDVRVGDMQLRYRDEGEFLRALRQRLQRFVARV